MRSIRAAVVAMVGMAIMLAAVLATAQGSGFRPTGPTTWVVIVGSEAVMEDTEYTGGERMRFGVPDLTIKVVDTVEWVQKSKYVPHTISFLSGADETPLTITEGGILYANPAVEKPAGGVVYDGTGVVSSGFPGGVEDLSPHFHYARALRIHSARRDGNERASHGHRVGRADQEGGNRKAVQISGHGDASRGGRRS